MAFIPICSVFVLNDKNEILCVRQRYDRINGDAWTLPGGGIDDGETPEQASIREVREETGLHVFGAAEKVYDVRCNGMNESFHVHGLLYRQYDGMVTISEEDVLEVAFLPLAQARSVMAVIDDEARLDPIFHVLDHLIATGTCDCFRCDYAINEDRAILHRSLAA